jgi:hypothetical protein
VRSGPLAPVLQALLVRDPAARPDAARLDEMLAQVEHGATPHWAQPTATTAPPAPTPDPVPHPLTQLDTPRPTTPHPRPDHAPGRARSRAPIVIAVIAVALAVTAATALALMLGDRNSNEARGGTSSTPATQQPRQSPEPNQQPTPAQTPTPTPTPTPTEQTAGPTTSPAAPKGGRWIAQLYSEPVSAGTAARDRRLARIRQSVPGAVYVRSDNFASLRPGFWVIYAPGPFANGRVALTFCRERGRTTANTCLGRYLSKDPADSALQCRPPAANPTGRCTRP